MLLTARRKDCFINNYCIEVNRAVLSPSMPPSPHTKVEFLTTDRILSAFFRRFIKGALTTLTLSLTQLTPEP